MPILQKKKFQIDNQNFCLKKLKEKSKLNPKKEEGREIMTRMEINEIDYRKSLKKINEVKSSLFEKISPGPLSFWPLWKF